MKSAHERLRDKSAEVERKRREIHKAAVAGDPERVAHLALEFDTLKEQQAQLELECRLLEIGRFVCEYGRRDLWKALWCRFAFDDRSDDGWNLAEDYWEGDELRFVVSQYYGANWRDHVARLDALDPREATHVFDLRDGRSEAD